MIRGGAVSLRRNASRRSFIILFSSCLHSVPDLLFITTNPAFSALRKPLRGNVSPTRRMLSVQGAPINYAPGPVNSLRHDFILR